MWESAAAGADALLLIVAALDDATLARLLAETAEAGLEALVEVHDGAELQRALAADARIIGVNNRNLRTLEVSLDVSLALVGAIPDDVVAVAESGLRTGSDLARLARAGYDAFLIGESLMSTGDPGARAQTACWPRRTAAGDAAVRCGFAMCAKRSDQILSVFTTMGCARPRDRSGEELHRPLAMIFEGGQAIWPVSGVRP